jgi:hypothetical protein
MAANKFKPTKFFSGVSVIRGPPGVPMTETGGGRSLEMPFFNSTLTRPIAGKDRNARRYKYFKRGGKFTFYEYGHK